MKRFLHNYDFALLERKYDMGFKSGDNIKWCLSKTNGDRQEMILSCDEIDVRVESVMALLDGMEITPRRRLGYEFRDTYFLPSGQTALYTRLEIIFTPYGAPIVSLSEESTEEGESRYIGTLYAGREYGYEPVASTCDYIKWNSIKDKKKEHPADGISRTLPFE
ncbi:MAG: hypothetical protein ACYC0V_18175 [Armatimonadota bacterium]